jgi:predicted DNA-binding transcriptional regulator YafY
MKPKKKPDQAVLPKTALPRIYRIDEIVASGRHPNTRQLAEILEVSVPTISRDIDFLRDRLNAPIEYDSFHRGYYYTKKNFRLPAIYAGAEELLALSMAKNIVTLYRDTPVYEAAEGLLKNIIAPLNPGGNPDWLEKRIVVPRIASAKIEKKIWDAIVQSLKENSIITFDYKKGMNEDCQTRRVRPYQLLFDSGLWYLISFDETRKHTRVFSLPRINNVVLTKDKFEFPKDFDYGNLTGGSFFGVYEGEKNYRYTIDCYAGAAIYANDRRWAEDQKIREFDGGLRFEFSSTQYSRVLRWVLSCGMEAIPRKPKELVEDWKQHIKVMVKNTI